MFGQVLSKLFTFLINTTDKVIYKVFNSFSILLSLYYNPDKQQLIYIKMRYFLTWLIPTTLQIFVNHKSHLVEAKVLFGFNNHIQICDLGFTMENNTKVNCIYIYTISLDLSSTHTYHCNNLLHTTWVLFQLAKANFERANYKITLKLFETYGIWILTM